MDVKEDGDLEAGAPAKTRRRDVVMLCECDPVDLVVQEEERERMPVDVVFMVCVWFYCLMRVTFEDDLWKGLWWVEWCVKDVRDRLRGGCESDVNAIAWLAIFNLL